MLSRCKFKLFLLSLLLINPQVNRKGDQMKLITFEKKSSVCVGVLTDKGIMDLTDRFQSVKNILTGGHESLEKIRSILDNCKTSIR